MGSLIQRALPFPWIAAGVVIALCVGVGLGADEGPERGAHSAASAAHGDEGHAGAGDGHADAAHGGDHGEDAHGAVGHGGDDYNKVPLVFQPALFVWSLGLFLLFLFLSRQFAWKPLIAGLDAREARVNRALHDAEAARIEAEKLLADHEARMEQVQEQVKGIVAAARKEAEAEKARIIAEADAEAAAKRDQAIADIRSAQQQAMDDLHAEIERQASIATAQVLA